MTDPAKSRRLLLVSYWYPPAVGAAAERMHSFAKYLPALGWDVRVLTARHGEGPHADPGVIAVVDPWRMRSAAIADYDPFAKLSFSSRLRVFLRDCIFPDRFVRWQRAAFDAVQSLISQWPPDVILASFPPASAVELALRIQSATGAPLVLDYRDKWIGPGGYEPKRAAMRRRHEELERQALAASSAVTAVSEALLNDAVKTHPRSNDRTAVIYNGFEPIEELEECRPRQIHQSNTAIQIAHVGTVIPRNRPELFFSSLSQLVTHQTDAIHGVHFRFVGNLSAGFAANKTLSPWLTSTGLVSRDIARAEMFNTDALLLLTGDYVGKWGYSVKLFEYLQTGRPILCLEESPGSNDARLLRELAPDRAFIGRLGDPGSLSEQLARLRTYLSTESAKPAGVRAPSPGLARFSRANQAARLDAFLRELRIPD